ncbi:MAG: hypothetical protein IPL27_22950 [Lewinellaceae bacterium]|nr:hypothetical protein [Lewinellaceae bacterium]
MTFAELVEVVLSHNKELADINEVLKWLGEENQTRADEIAALRIKDEAPADEPQRPRIGFKK